VSSFRDCIIAATLLLSTGCAAPHPAPKLSIAAAADLRFALDEIVRGFRTAHPKLDVRTVYGSSGNFYSQIRSRAPFDVLLSADVEYPRKLAAEGLAVRDSVFTYAVGRIVLWVPANSPIDPAGAHMQALEAAAVRHIAIANPQHAPYGRAAEAAIRSAGLYDRVASKFVLGENIAQTLEFVQTGAADVGIVALSLALAPTIRDRGKYWEVPLDSYPRVEQGGAILHDSQAARDFVAFLRGGDATNVLRQYGFYLPGH
jgi:molybdate transport system substrate-binding protein